MMHTFEANGRTWKTDVETLGLLREYRGNETMLAFVFHAGRATGRIVEVN